MIESQNFFEKVYEVAKLIPFGRVTSYGAIARYLGAARSARMVGWAMFHAPKEWCLPCHRVVNSQGRLVPGWQEQKALLEKEGVTLKANGCVNMKLHQWQPADHE